MKLDVTWIFVEKKKRKIPDIGWLPQGSNWVFQTVLCFLHFLNFLLHLSHWAQQSWAPDKLLNGVSFKWLGPCAWPVPGLPTVRIGMHLLLPCRTNWANSVLSGHQIKKIGERKKVHRVVSEWTETVLLPLWKGNIRKSETPKITSVVWHPAYFTFTFFFLFSFTWI